MASGSVQDGREDATLNGGEKRVFNAMYTICCSTLEGIFRQRVLKSLHYEYFGTVNRPLTEITRYVSAEFSRQNGDQYKQLHNCCVPDLCGAA